jgi:nicotinate-nucleotide adenylyltransferase
MKIKQSDATMETVANKPVRLALFGGSFDPVHCAHLEVAHCALEQASLDCVVFIPASQSPLKHKPFAKDVERLQMLRLALQGEVKFKLDTFEIGQTGSSFTIDTVDHFRELYGGAELFWIIGEDQLAQLDKWHRIDELVQKINFLVYPRLGSRLTDEVPINELRYQVLKAEKMPVSSTEIRERCEKRLPLRGLVPDSVEAFIYKQGLYKKEIKHT